MFRNFGIRQHACGYSGDDNEGAVYKMTVRWHGGPVTQSGVACMEESAAGWNWLHAVQTRDQNGRPHARPVFTMS